MRNVEIENWYFVTIKGIKGDQTLSAVIIFFVLKNRLPWDRYIVNFKVRVKARDF